MDTAIATFQADKKAAFTPKLGKVRPIDIISLERRVTKEDTVADLIEDLARDRRFLHPIGVRHEGEGRYLLISGYQRLEAWKRHFGKRQPIQAFIFPSDMPDARIALLDAGEDLHRKDLTPPERQAVLLRYAAARKEEEGQKLATELPLSGSDARSASKGGRGKKAATAKLAGELGLSKSAVQKQMKAASEAIGEPIDLDHDTPEELERKAAELETADKSQRAKAKVVRLKRKPDPRVEDAMPPAEPQAKEIGSRIEGPLKVVNAMSRADRLLIVYYTCIGLGLDPLKMAPLEAFGLAEGEPELNENAPAAVAPATDDAPVAQAEPGDGGADLATEDLQVADEDGSDDAAAEVGETADQEEDPGAEDLEGAGDDGFEAADPEPAGANFDAEDLQDFGDHTHQAANQEPDGATKCAYCNIPFESGDQLEEFNGQIFHAFCVEDGKRLAKSEQGKPIAIAA